MATVLERALAQYDSRKTHEVEVPEWGEGGKPLTVHFRTPTLATMSKVQRESEGDTVKMAAMVVAQCALDSAGNRMFTAMNWKDLFTGADPTVVTRISEAIMGHLNFSAAAVVDAEKN